MLYPDTRHLIVNKANTVRINVLCSVEVGLFQVDGRDGRAERSSDRSLRWGGNKGAGKGREEMDTKKSACTEGETNSPMMSVQF